MKTSLFVPLFLCPLVISIAPFVATADDQPPSKDPLQKNIEATYSCDSFDDAIRLIGSRTGMKVDCPPEIAGFMRSIHARAASPLSYDMLQGPVTAREFLDQVCSQFALSWQYDPKSAAITLALPPKSPDSRPLPDLLAYLSSASPGVTEMNDIYRSEWGAAFYSLLTTNANMKTGWKTFLLFNRENSVSPVSHASFASTAYFKPAFSQEITDAAGKKTVIVMLTRPGITSPGRSSLFYYWFGKDGALLASGWVNLGYYTLLACGADGTPGTAKDSPPEIHMGLKGTSGYLLARFTLDPRGLKLSSLLDARGAAVDPGDFGKSLIPAPPAQ